MQLYDRGLLTLDGDVNKHLDFVLQNPSYPEVPVTMRQLLSHTSSIDDEQYSSRQVYDHIIVDGDWPGSPWHRRRLPV